MANYEVDIEIAIKGSQKLKEFERSLKGVTKDVTALNKAIKKTKDVEEESFKVANVNAYARAVRRAEAAVRKVAVGTTLEKEAIQKLARARKEHNSVLERQNRLMAQAIADQREIVATANAGFGVQGPQAARTRFPRGPVSPIGGMKQPGTSGATAANRGTPLPKRFNAALTAGAFPLLFGGGAFTALGGAAGGALTGQLFGGATVAFQVLGSALDAFTAQTAQLGQALNPLTADLDALIKASGNVNSETSHLIQQLEEAGQTSAALTLATQEMAGVIGADGVDALRIFGEDTVELGNEFSRALTIMGSAIAGFINTVGVVKGVIGGMERFNLRSQARQILDAEPGSAKARRLKATLGPVSADTGMPEITPKTLEVMKQINQEGKNRVSRNALILQQSQNVHSIEQQTLALRQSGLEVSDREHLDANIRIANNEAANKVQIASLDLNNKLAVTEAKRSVKQEYNNTLKEIETDRQAKILDLEKKHSDAVARKVKQAEAQTRREEAAAKRKAGQMQRAGEQQQKSLERAVALETRFAREVELREASTRFEKEKLRIEFQLEDKLNAIAKLDDQSLAVQSEKNARRAAELQLIEAQRKEEERIADLRVRSLQEQGVPLSMEFAGLFGAYQSGGMGNFDLSTGIADLVRTEVALQAVLDKYPQIEEASQAMAETVTFGFRDIVDGAKSAEEVFADFLNGIADMLLRTAAQMIAQYIAIGIARQFAGLGTPYTPKFDGSSLFNQAPIMTGFPGLANGGTATAGRPYIVGERGPELFVPGQTGTVVPNHAMGGANVTVNVDASGTQAQGNQPNAKLLGQAIGAAVQAELIKQKRPGGLLAV